MYFGCDTVVRGTDVLCTLVEDQFLIFLFIFCSLFSQKFSRVELKSGSFE